MDHVLGRFLSLLTSSEVDAPSTEHAIRLFAMAADSRSSAVHGGGALRFHHLMDAACHRSPIIGDRYRELIGAARGRLAAGVEGDQARGTLRSDVSARRIGALITAIGLGVTAMIELELPVAASEIAETVIALLASPRRPSKKHSKS